MSADNAVAGRNALLAKWDERVGKALKASKKQHDVYKKCREAVALAQKKEGRRVNPYLIHSTLSALVPALYAKNPEIEVRPAQAAVSVQGAVSPAVAFAQTAQELLQLELVVNADLKRRMKSCLLSALTTGVGWLKLSLQDEYGADPLLKARLPDAQDNVAQLDALARGLDEAGADEDLMREELRLQSDHVEAALQGQSELFVQKGLVVDRVPSEDVFVLDAGITSLTDYAQAQALAQRVWMTAEEYKRVFAADELPGGVRRFGRDRGESVPQADASEDEVLLEVWEVWDRSSQHVFTFARGADEWARPPYSPQPVGERWFPFFALVFNPVDGRFHPLSDVETLIDYQEEYCHLRSQLRDSRQYNKPVFVVPKAGDLSAAEAQNLTERVRDDESGTWVAARINPSQPINASIQQFPLPQLNQGLFDPSMVFRDVEMTMRSGDAARGYINKAKTATEAEIMSLGMQSGVSERQDVMEDLMRDMSRYALEIMVQAYSPQEVAGALGADVLWQNMGIDQAYRYLHVDIKAGSMSKPNKFQEREQWLQLMPLLQQSVAQMAQMHMQGQGGMAQAMRKLLEETLKRFDERIDLDEFLPDFGADMMQQQMMQMVQQAMPPTEGLAQFDSQQQQQQEVV